MLQQYIATGSYVNDCGNGLQQPVTGSAVFTGFFDQCDAEAHAYLLAIDNAAYLRSLSPCLSDATTPTTTTTTTSTTTLPPDLPASGNIFYDWTGHFIGENSEYYDIVAWGKTNGLLSGNTFGSNQYFASIAANDINGLGTVLAIIKGSGIITGFGDNTMGFLNIPTGLTNMVQVSIGYDHCLALKNDGTVTGWGRDNWGALNILPNITTARKVCAGVGGSVFLLAGGKITGTSTINGGTQINYPLDSGYLDIDHYSTHILALNSGGLLTGVGSNVFGESVLKYISGVKGLSAGISTSMAVYNDGYITGYGTQQAIFNTPNVSTSGVSVFLRGHIGTVLLKNQDISQWVSPWNDEYGNAVKPEYLKNNVVSIAQGTNFTAAIFKRLYSGTNLIQYPITGHNYLWKVTYVGGVDSYGGISINDLYAPLSTVIQTCDNYSFNLPAISGVGQSYTGAGVPNCSNYAGTHSIIFNSVRSQYPLLNINYNKSGYHTKTGFAATGITTGDYWNNYYPHEGYNKVLYYSDNTISPVSGGWINSIFSGTGATFPHPDNMYSSFISGISGYNIWTNLTNFETGHYQMLVYAHASGSGRHSRVLVLNNGITASYYTGTTTGVEYSSPIFAEGRQYVNIDFKIGATTDDIFINLSGAFINGIQIIKLD